MPGASIRGCGVADQQSALQTIINRPYDPPTKHFAHGPNGLSGAIATGRRPSSSYIPIRGAQQRVDPSAVELDFDLTRERRQENELINQLRADVELWRARGYEHVTQTSRKLLLHWADEHRENRVLFGQREAAETAIFLAEGAGRSGYHDWNRTIQQANDDYNEGMPRIALKLATGAGKTVVMAMLIAWQTLNRQFSSASSRNRWSQKFLLIAPGITIRERLQVLLPERDDNYYDERELVPADLRPLLNRAQVVVANYHGFQPRSRREFQGVNDTTKRILADSADVSGFLESEAEVVTRVLRGLGTIGRAEPVMVLNDEAHHCYRDRPQATAGLKLTADQRAELADARVWFRGIQAIARHHRVQRVIDLSATPYFLSGSGYTEGYLFPWVVSDYSLMDAIEAGIVKIPRVPVLDDSRQTQPAYLNLWEQVGRELPKRSSPQDSGPWAPPEMLEQALLNLYSSYRRSYESWERELRDLGEPPPVMIVVCSNTVVSRLVHEWIAGVRIDGPEGPTHRAGALALFSNEEQGEPLQRPRTILVDSAELERGELGAGFRAAAAAEIEAFQQELRRSRPGSSTDELDDAALLREVLNTVGKKGKLGEHVRCVVSVAMLTEGWDANTVTHILGVRAFGSQLLCEQVVGRGLRRRSYAIDDDGFLSPEYSNVYGIPFAFIPGDGTAIERPPAPPAKEVGSVEGRAHLRIRFPRVDGYRYEVPDSTLHVDVAALRRFAVTKDAVPEQVLVEGVVGQAERVGRRDEDVREQRAAYAIAERIYQRQFLGRDAAEIRPWVFPQLLEVARRYLADRLDYDDGVGVGRVLATSSMQAEIAEIIWRGVTTFGSQGDRSRLPQPILRQHDPVGETGNVFFLTRKAVHPTRKSEISHVVLDGPGGNTWEQIVAMALELDDDVAAYVKNDRLGFSIPYVHQGRTHQYFPDFLVRLAPRADDDVRYLIVEVSGGQKSPGPTRAKADTALQQWCPAINNHGGFGRWGYTELTTMLDVDEVLRGAIAALYADDSVVGNPDRLSAVR